MSIKAETISTSTTAVAVQPTNDQITRDGFSYSFEIPSGATFYIGGSDVTSAGANGRQLAEGDVVEGDSSEGILYVVNDTGSVDVDVVFGRVKLA